MTKLKLAIVATAATGAFAAPIAAPAVAPVAHAVVSHSHSQSAPEARDTTWCPACVR